MHTWFVYLQQGWGYDFRRGLNVSRGDYGVYATDIFTDEAVSVIRTHAREKNQVTSQGEERPLFLYLAHLAVHSANTYSPLQVIWYTCVFWSCTACVYPQPFL